jgi:hypothetical protein
MGFIFPLKIENMIYIVGLLIGFCFFLLKKIVELKNRLGEIEKTLKSINYDLNMVAYSQKNSKQILKG